MALALCPLLFISLPGKIFYFAPLTQYIFASLLVIYCAFPKTGTKFGVEVCHVLEYDTEQQVLGNHLLCAWETLEEARESSRKAHTRLSV